MRLNYSKGSLSYLNPRTIGLNKYPEEDAIFKDLYEEYKDDILITYNKTKKFLEMVCNKSNKVSK